MKKLLIVTLILLIAFQFVYSKYINTDDKRGLKILVYTKSNGYRHESVSEASSVMKDLAVQNNWMIKLTEDSTYFTSDSLKLFDVTVFLLTTGDILDTHGKKAFKKYIRSGGGLLTIHSGTITMQEWPWFKRLMGAGFLGHPPVQQGRLIIEDRKHPSTGWMGESELLWTEEWYSFDRNPRSSVHVIMSVDENSYNVDDNRWFENIRQKMGDHPVVWCHEKEGGRVFQTALGHEASAYHDAFLQKHIIGAILWAARK